MQRVGRLAVRGIRCRARSSASYGYRSPRASFSSSRTDTDKVKRKSADNRQQLGPDISDDLLLELKSDRRKAIHMLVSNFTAPALASALVDREKVLARCARYAAEGRGNDLSKLLSQFLVPDDSTPQSSIPSKMTPDFFSSMEDHLSRLPRVYQGLTGPLERRASVLIPLCHDCGVPSVLFTRRADTLRRHAGQVCFPGGMVDPEDYSIKHSALRELNEEIGIRRDDVKLLGVLRCDWAELASLTGVAVTPIVAVLKRDVADLGITPNPDEVGQWFTIPLDELNNDSLWVRRKYGEKVYSPVFHSSSALHTIWGLTAYIADRFMRKVVRRSGSGAPGILEKEIKIVIRNDLKADKKRRDAKKVEGKDQVK